MPPSTMPSPRAVAVPNRYRVRRAWSTESIPSYRPSSANAQAWSNDHAPRTRVMGQSVR
jgi:hypothetical protein